MRQSSFMRASLVLAIAAATAVMATLPARASSMLEVSPIRIALPVERPMATLHLHNHGERETTVHLDAMRWRQENGEDIYEPDDTLLVTPPIVHLPAGEEQLVRIGLSEPKTGATTGAAYRVFIREVPREESFDAATVRVVLQIGVPVFVLPAHHAHAKVDWRIVRRSGGLFSIEAQNVGDVHVQITNIGVRKVGGTTAAADLNTMRYVLPGSTVSWPLDAADSRAIANLPERIAITAVTDQGVMNAEITRE
ncbi:MAG: fimbria/pilus periplasmic chaperone [Parvibaculum sp.]|uniref:fimbrial biogenesis chaperone n=1 Tax=Parvibaculum sp. TaxID=2024848 RepID=UPI0027204B32|nr:fimbria/pilus periplasmic chaperone [Parvibaculum sp.]MDO8838567.1 fimbria/pilus periplasmic chaperone [Parvibaculum sp.]